MRCRQLAKTGVDDKQIILGNTPAANKKSLQIIKI